MAKILAPNKEYTGISASVPFINGEGHTDDLRLIEWFKDHGYEVIEEKEVDKNEIEKEIDKNDGKKEDKIDEVKEEKTKKK